MCERYFGKHTSDILETDMISGECSNGPSGHKTGFILFPANVAEVILGK
jgi:hypothetical protein